jgi:transposase InsO family protein
VLAEPDFVHSDRGVQYLAIRYTERLEEAGAVASVGSRGDSYDNALAETVNGLLSGRFCDRLSMPDNVTIARMWHT